MCTELTLNADITYMLFLTFELLYNLLLAQSSTISSFLATFPPISHTNNQKCVCRQTMKVEIVKLQASSMSQLKVTTSVSAT